ncbi:MAG: ATP-dependent RNA helicase RhlE [Janthinobacterium sp.]|jgi:ATP-dependent RNA helicase RhlE
MKWRHAGGLLYTVGAGAVAATLVRRKLPCHSSYLLRFVMSFSSLGLAPALLRSVGDSGYLVPTAIQAAAIPAILRGADVLGRSQTGSGKTAAFVLPLLQALLDGAASASLVPSTGRRVRALILVPTRELAAQVGAEIDQLARHVTLPQLQAVKVAVLFGGVSINPQMMGLRGGADIVVATPGRLLDLIEHNALKLDALSTLVLDEADRLLDLGFADEVQRILALLPAQRQTLFFSATYTPSVQALAQRMLRDPVKIEVAAEAPLPGAAPAIGQRVIAVDVPRRTQLLKHLILENKWPRVLVFVATKYAAMHVADKLQRNGILAGALHGDASQGARSEVLKEFKESRLQVLVATDVAARGIDIAQLPVVVNYDLPRSAQDYTHRIGRTGRAGATGVAVSFVTAAALAHWRLIEKRHALTLELETVAGFEPLEAPVLAAGVADLNGGVKGRRPSKKDKLRAAASDSDAADSSVE